MFLFFKKFWKFSLNFEEINTTIKKIIVAINQKIIPKIKNWISILIESLNKKPGNKAIKNKLTFGLSKFIIKPTEKLFVVLTKLVNLDFLELKNVLPAKNKK